MPTKSDSINLHERSLSFIFMKNIKLIPSLFLEILQPTYLTSFFRLKSPAIISSNTIFCFRKCKIIFSKFCHFWVKKKFYSKFYSHELQELEIQPLPNHCISLKFPLTWKLFINNFFMVLRMATKHQIKILFIENVVFPEYEM